MKRTKKRQTKQQAIDRAYQQGFERGRELQDKQTKREIREVLGIEENYE